MTFLPRADVVRLTGRERYSAQRRVLERLGIRYLQAPSGEPLIRTEWLDVQPERCRDWTASETTLGTLKDMPNAD